MAFALATAATTAPAQGRPQGTALRGAGATFPAPVYARWIDEYRQARGVALTYEPVGSGAGVERIVGGQLDFAGTDVALSDAELRRTGLMQFPAVIGAVVPVLNVTGIKSGTLKLDGHVLAEIFLGRVTKWNDPAIGSLNAGLSLPDANITVVHRSDASGTSYLWSEFLSRSDASWQSAVGAGEVLAWPRGVAAQGNEGVASVVQRTRMSLGYVEFAYAVRHGLSVAALQNRAGRFVVASRASVEAVASDASWERASDLAQPLVDQGSPAGWPVAAQSFILLPLAPSCAERAAEVIRFFDWAYTDGRSSAENLDYAPLPPAAVALVRALWADRLAQGLGAPLRPSPGP